MAALQPFAIAFEVMVDPVIASIWSSDAGFCFTTVNPFLYLVILINIGLKFIFFKNSIFVFFESLIPLFSVLPVNKKSAFLFDLLFNFLN